MKRPRVIINCAASADGKLATVERRQTRISSPEDMRRVHRLRASADAILVGIGTVLADDPRLTVKKRYLGGLKGAKNPIRIILDSKGRTPRNAKALDGSARTIVAVASRPRRPIKGADVLVCGKKGRVDLRRLLAALQRMGVRRLMVEGGGEVIWSFLGEGLADELKIFIGNVAIGGRTAPTVADGAGARNADQLVRLRLSKVTRMKGGVLLEYEVAGR